MKKIISSKFTFINKFVLPVGWLLFCMSQVAFALRNWSTNKTVLFAIFLLLLTAFIYWFALKSMKISVSEDFLYVSNFLEEIEIPLTQIEKVKVIRFLRGHPTYIHLKDPSEFGSKILFYPPMNLLALEPHENVDQLRGLVERKRRSLERAS